MSSGKQLCSMETQDILERTVKVRLPECEHSYVEEDFVDSIGKILPDGEELALGHIKRNQEWHITVRSRGGVEKLLQAKELVVAGQRGVVFKCGVQESQVRIHTISLWK